MPERATLDELLDFANKVREAGGGNPLDALMPAVPEDATQCLIAKNLNFNCSVGGGPGQDHPLHDSDAWWMTVADRDVRDRIAAALGLVAADYDVSPGTLGAAGDDFDWFEAYGVKLPPRIGQVAADFDNWSYAIHVSEYNFVTGDDVWAVDADADYKDKQALVEFWPLIEASAKEAYANATFVNDKGEIVL